MVLDELLTDPSKQQQAIFRLLDQGCVRGADGPQNLLKTAVSTRRNGPSWHSSLNRTAA